MKIDSRKTFSHEGECTETPQPALSLYTFIHRHDGTILRESKPAAFGATGQIVFLDATSDLSVDLYFFQDARGTQTPIARAPLRPLSVGGKDKKTDLLFPGFMYAQFWAVLVRALQADAKESRLGHTSIAV